MELIIASGKGGTGKTSLVGSLARLAGQAVLVDCDVDAANLHLIVSHTVRQRHQFSVSSRARIIREKCIPCGICAEVCRSEAILQGSNNRDTNCTDRRKTDPADSGFYRIDPLLCDGCELCVRVCPLGAIQFEPVVSGEWYVSESEYGPFLHARLGVAEANSGRLVSILRREAGAIARRGGLDLTLVDGPPGIGCPVIASLTGASYLLIVTEPSLAALHDMKRLLELAGHFQIRAGIVINKCDINENLADSIASYTATLGVPIHGRIPFDPVFTSAQVLGRPYVDVAGQREVAVIRKIWQSVKQEANESQAVGRKFAV
jgi:MinD superfamily P-loop ATPase